MIKKTLFAALLGMLLASGLAAAKRPKPEPGVQSVASGSQGDWLFRPDAKQLFFLDWQGEIKARVSASSYKIMMPARRKIYILARVVEAKVLTTLKKEKTSEEADATEPTEKIEIYDLDGELILRAPIFSEDPILSPSGHTVAVTRKDIDEVVIYEGGRLAGELPLFGSPSYVFSKNERYLLIIDQNVHGDPKFSVWDSAAKAFTVELKPLRVRPEERKRLDKIGVDDDGSTLKLAGRNLKLDKRKDRFVLRSGEISFPAKLEDALQGAVCITQPDEAQFEKLKADGKLKEYIFDRDPVQSRSGKLAVVPRGDIGAIAVYKNGKLSSELPMLGSPRISFSKNERFILILDKGATGDPKISLWDSEGKYFCVEMKAVQTKYSWEDLVKMDDSGAKFYVNGEEIKIEHERKIP